MEKLRALILTEGMHGMISQAEGMAKALNTRFSHKIVKLNFPWNFIPPKVTPISKIVLRSKINLNQKDFPNLIISCGRKSVIPSIIIKKQYPKLFTIHIQNPKVNFKYFDAIVAPHHDGIHGQNVYSSLGAIHYITEKEIERSKNYLADKIKSKRIVSLILGGPNKYYSFNRKQLLKIFNKIKSAFVSKGYQVVIIPSIRTPKKCIELAIKEMGACGHIVKYVDKQAYLSAYAWANYVVVTCDSTSMISEAATSGKPVYIAHMKTKRNNYRFRKFFKLFNDMGITRDLTSTKDEPWTYDKYNEAERIASKIKDKIKK